MCLPGRIQDTRDGRNGKSEIFLAMPVRSTQWDHDFSGDLMSGGELGVRGAFSSSAGETANPRPPLFRRQNKYSPNASNTTVHQGIAMAQCGSYGNVIASI